MNDSDYVRLGSELANDPLGRKYGDMTAEEAAASLNTVDRDVVDSTQYTYREYMRRYGADSAMMSNIKAADPETYMILTDFGGDGGLDFSSALMQAAMAVMAAGGVLTETQASNWRSLGVKTVSRAEELGFNGLMPKHIAWVRSGVR